MTDYEKFKKLFDELGIDYVEEEGYGDKILRVDAEICYYVYIVFDMSDKFKQFEVC